MKLTDSLTQLGLTKKEAAVYLAALELGLDNVGTIAKKARVKRPTAYVTLDSLKSKGMVSAVPKGGTTLYSAEAPSKLEQDFRTKQKILQNALPQLEALFNRHDTKPEIRFYEGYDQLLAVYWELVRETQGELLFFGTSISAFKKHYADFYYSCLPIMQKQGYHVREIATDDAEGREHVRYIQKHYSDFYDLRLTSEDYPFYEDNAVFNNKVLIASLKDDLFGVLITSESIANTFRSIFELAWQSAREV